ncbi:MAG TPA: GNAT family N-acetyltransferase [Gemmatimonadales bacterium]
MPPALLQVSRKMGGIVAGAFDGDRLIGFVYGITGVRDGAVAHWSHMLAVTEAWRDRGIGRRLKAYQRTELLAAGITRMFWTFDPLVARNAHLNLERLGVRVVEYVRDMYGDNPMSRTDSVIGSDRFVVEWALDNATRTGSRNGGTERSAGDGDVPRIRTASDPLPDVPRVAIAVPPDIQALKQRHPGAALAWRASTRRAFEHYLARGYAVTGFARGTEETPSAYRLERRA